jgi:Multicopper oxidase
MLPVSGYLVIAFNTDNPGIWPMLSHIGWQTSQGFVLQLVERMNRIPVTIDQLQLKDTCTVHTHKVKWVTVTGQRGSGGLCGVSASITSDYVMAFVLHCYNILSVVRRGLLLLWYYGTGGISLQSTGIC